MYKLNIYIYIYRFGAVSLRFADLAANHRTGRLIIAPGTFGGTFGGRIGVVSGGFVGVGELLNRPNCHFENYYILILKYLI